MKGVDSAKQGLNGQETASTYYNSSNSASDVVYSDMILKPDANTGSRPDDEVREMNPINKPPEEGEYWKETEGL